MGVDVNTARFLAWAGRRGVDFAETAMLGRHQFMGVTKRALARVLDRSGKGGKENEDCADGLLNAREGYAEGFFEHLGARTVHSYDASDYEKATHLWDMNHAPPPDAVGRYSLVFDGGTLEHVFHFPTALRGAMAMVKPGGHLVVVTPASGWFGHGFYQFSAELFFQVFQAQNGFQHEAVLMHEDRPGAVFHQLREPGECGGRHKFVSLRPALLAVVAKRLGPVPAVLSLQQSDYMSTWATASENGIRERVRPWGGLLAELRRRMKIAYLSLGGNPFFDDVAFSRIDVDG